MTFLWAFDSSAFTDKLIWISSWIKQYLGDLNRFNSWYNRFSRNWLRINSWLKWIQKDWLMIQHASQFFRFKSTHYSSEKHFRVDSWFDSESYPCLVMPPLHILKYASFDVESSHIIYLSKKENIRLLYFIIGTVVLFIQKKIFPHKIATFLKSLYTDVTDVGGATTVRVCRFWIRQCSRWCALRNQQPPVLRSPPPWKVGGTSVFDLMLQFACEN